MWVEGMHARRWRTKHCHQTVNTTIKVEWSLCSTGTRMLWYPCLRMMKIDDVLLGTCMPMHTACVRSPC